MLIVQRNVRAWCTLRTWHWFKLYGRVKPLIKGNKKDEEMEALAKKLVINRLLITETTINIIFAGSRNWRKVNRARNAKEKIWRQRMHAFRCGITLSYGRSGE